MFFLFQSNETCPELECVQLLYNLNMKNLKINTLFLKLLKKQNVTCSNISIMLFKTFYFAQMPNIISK